MESQMGETYGTHGEKNAWYWLEELTGREFLEDVDIDGRLLIKCISNKRVKRVRITFM
jgi:hypothetical protein